MTKKPAHQCLTCNLAEWKKTPAGKMHRDGGLCQWKLPHIPKSVVFGWSSWQVGLAAPPIYGTGRIARRPFAPTTNCETYEALP